jgi:RNA polymerase sigma factor (sigma-70 family)
MADVAFTERRLDHAEADTADVRRLAEEAASWLDVLKNANEKEKVAFFKWLTTSPTHMTEFLRMCALEYELKRMAAEASQEPATNSVHHRGPSNEDVSFDRLPGAKERRLRELWQNTAQTSTLPEPEAASFSLLGSVVVRADPQNQLYAGYRRLLLSVFHHTQINPDTAEDLVQHTLLRVIEKSRVDGFEDARNLEGYLHRIANRSAVAHRSDELSGNQENNCESLTEVVDDSLTPEERIDHEQLAQLVRELMSRLPVQRDREVLERVYLEEESRTSVRLSLNLTDVQLSQILWRARRRFRDVLTRSEVADSLAEVADVNRSVLLARAHRITRELDAAEDIVQDTLQKLTLRHREGIQSLHDYALMSIERSARYWQSEKQREARRIDHRACPEDCVAEGDFDVRLQAQEELIRVLARLSPKVRQAFIYCKWWGYTLEEAAGEMGITVSTVKEHLRSAAKSFSQLREKASGGREKSRLARLVSRVAHHRDKT